MSTSAFATWEATVTIAERDDPLWRLLVYRRARYLLDRAWPTTRKLERHVLGRRVADQLWRALGSICANLAEGFGRGTGMDRARFFEFALGSARESIVWYQAARPMLGAEVDEPIEELAELRRMLIALLPRIRRQRVRGT